MTRFTLAMFIGAFLLLPAEAPAQVTGSWLPRAAAVEMREATFGWGANRQVLEKAVINEKNERIGAIARSAITDNHATDPPYAMLGLRQCNAENTVDLLHDYR